MPVGDEDHGAVAVGVAAEALATGLAQALDLFAGEELARSELAIGAPSRRKCPILDGRSPLGSACYTLVFHRPSIHECPIYEQNRDSLAGTILVCQLLGARKGTPF